MILNLLKVIKKIIFFLKNYKFLLPLLILTILFVWVEFNISKFAFLNTFQKKFIIFIMIQINLIFILILLYFIFRYLFKIFLEIKVKKISKSLKFKLFGTYLISIIFPSLILIIGSAFFLKKSVDYWFKGFLREKFITNIMKTEGYYKDIEQELMQKGQEIIKDYISKTKHIKGKDLRWIRKIKYLATIDSIVVYTYAGKAYKKTYSSEARHLIGIPPSILEKIKIEQMPVSQISLIGSKAFIRVFIPTHDKKGIPYILSVGKLIDLSEFFSAKNISSEDIYKIFNTFLLISISLILLLVIFIGVWVGSKIARNLTEPLQNLIVATQKISQKDYAIENISTLPASEDEIGTLIKSFKEMVEKIKLYEEEMQKYTQYLKSILDHLPVGVLLLNKNLKIDYINESFRKLLEENQFLNIETFLNHLNIADLINHVDSKKPFYKTYTLSKDSKEIIIGITLSEIFLFKEKAYLLIVENLEEKEKLKKLSIWKEVATKIAHEIKNPLTPIKLSIQRLRKKLKNNLDEDQKKILFKTTEMVEKYVEELRKLATDFYYFSKTPLPELKKSSLIENIKETINLYEFAYPNIKIEFKHKNEIIFNFDPFQLKRVWINLLDNSIKAMEGNGKIEIEVYENKGNVNIIFSDNGSGLPDEIIEKFNLGEILDLKEIGTGLIMVYSVIKLHKGDIKIEKNIPKGTKFIITLPKI